MKKSDIFDLGRAAGYETTVNGTAPKDNPYKAGSWQHTAWAAGFETGCDAGVTAREEAKVKPRKKTPMMRDRMPLFPVSMGVHDRLRIARLYIGAKGKRSTNRAGRAAARIEGILSSHAERAALA